MPAVDGQGLTGLWVQGLRVLDGPPLDFAVAAGECVSLSGPSGVGKTVMLRALADLDPHVGTVSLDGVEAATIQPPNWRRRVGLLLADSAWWADRVVAHFPAHLATGGAPGGGDEALADWFARLGFTTAVLDWQVARLSSGERQRLALLRLLALRPRALLLDEPTANLDPDATARVEAVVTEYRRSQQSPVLWISHDAAQRERIAARHLLMGADGLSQRS